jgi:hypothetical protein
MSQLGDLDISSFAHRREDGKQNGHYRGHKTLGSESIATKTFQSYKVVTRQEQGKGRMGVGPLYLGRRAKPQTPSGLGSCCRIGAGFHSAEPRALN